ncbi:two component sensor histidine kinase [Acidomonas methanolica NBRC 104435]|uniref:histidine kinase n=2 Tax=Acidomonas methanolica TaxID=437 RepID=A0A023D7W5_ACIMT|nr:two component sensor histidine kinase [Acidomonas methanolica NBRC 104435]GEK97839.1 hypothetical protein AME01nite_03380 [Acidomonas methanolica NBRC 104435]
MDGVEHSKSQIMLRPPEATPRVNDLARLETLAHYHVLDTPSEQEFDDLTALAAMLCDAPTALISLVTGQRQWFKARQGFESAETPVAHSVCAWVVETRAAVEIPDLLLDGRTRTNPYVTGTPNLRFYAGEPLVAPDGEVLGSFCVFDTAPRPGGLRKEQRAGLGMLARQAMRLLEARRLILHQRDCLVLQARVSAEVEARAEALAAAQRDILHRYRVVEEASAAGRVGTFEIDVLRNVAYPSALTCRLFGLPVVESCSVRTLIERIVPEDRNRASSLVSRRLGTGVRSAEYRVKRADTGETRWLARDSAFVRDRDGVVIRMVGTFQDVTAEKEANARLEALVTLGDVLREAENVEAALQASIPLLGTTLDAMRTGLITFDHPPGDHPSGDHPSGQFVVAHEWVREGVRPTAGRHDLAPFAEMTTSLEAGRILVVDRADAVATATQREILRACGIGAFVVVPVLLHGVLEGGLFMHHAEPHVWSIDEVNFIEAVADRLQAAVAIAREQEQREFVAREIAHRFKNTLAVVQALARQTLRGANEKALVSVFERRLMALAAAHDLLFSQEWRDAALSGLVRQVIGALGMAARVEIDGPDLALGADACTALSLVLHELCTNAIKYGALSNATGRVRVWWVVRDGELALTWEEHGGPVVSCPERSGLGSRLIRAGFGGTSRAEVEYPPEGLRACFHANMAEIRAR